MKCHRIVLITILLSLLSCSESKHEQVSRLTREWSRKEILFPNGMEFSLYGKDFKYDTIPNAKYKIVTYIDSLGCASCKLKLPAWRNLIQQLDTMGLDVPILFFLHPFDSRGLRAILRRDNFNYPICMDIEDKLNKENNFPADINFQTFLLDKQNRVLAIGNPVHNHKVKELYFSILMSESKQPVNSTDISVQSSVINLGRFKKVQRDTIIYIKNIGKERLVILDMMTSCGCTVVDYDKNPTISGDSLAFKIIYNPDKKGYFDKIVNVYCNTVRSPIQFHIRGTVE